MLKVLVNTTPLALWREVVHEAQLSCDIPLRENLESYLVYLLMRYMNRPEIVKEIMATQFMEGLNKGPNGRELALQGVGDTCLIFSGLFPGLAIKRLVKISYYVNLGRGAYIAISKGSDDLYAALAKEFVPIMDVLGSIRHYAKQYEDLLPLQAYDLWNELGSKRALKVLQSYSSHAEILPSNTDESLIKPK